MVLGYFESWNLLYSFDFISDKPVEIDNIEIDTRVRLVIELETIDNGVRDIAKEQR